MFHFMPFPSKRSSIIVVSCSIMLYHMYYVVSCCIMLIDVCHIFMHLKDSKCISKWFNQADSSRPWFQDSLAFRPQRSGRVCRREAKAPGSRGGSTDPVQLSYSSKTHLPSGYVKIAIENGHRNSGVSHKTWWFSIVMFV